MRFTQYLLVESKMAELKQIVDEVIDNMAEERQYDHDSIIRAVRARLEWDPDYANDPGRIETALELVSNYIR